MEEDQDNWQRLQKIAFDRKTTRKHVRKVEAATVRHARKFIGRRLENIVEVRRHVFVWLAGLVVLLAGVGLQQLWFQRAYTTHVAVPGGTYAEATLGRVTSLNPLYVQSSSELSASRLIFSSLLSYDTAGALGNDVAEKVSIDKKNTSYTVTLKPSVRWHDGARLTAHDVAFTIELIKNPAARSALRPQWQDVSVRVIDDLTVVFTLPSVYAAFPHALIFPILPKHVLGDISPSQLRENTFGLNPIGSGPFVVRFAQTASDKHSIVNLVAFNNYFKGQPKLARFEIHGYQDQRAIAAALRTGQVTATGDLTAIDEFAKAKPYVINDVALHSGVYAFFNATNPALKDVNVRSALRAATNLDMLRQKTGNQDRPLELPFVPGQLQNITTPKAPGYNVKAAEKLLDKAGWKRTATWRKKGSQVLTIAITTINNSNFEQAARLIADDWKRIGVNATVTVLDPLDQAQSFTQNVLQPRNYDVLVYELAIGADPDVYAFWHSSQAGPQGLNLSLYANPSSDDALTSARSRIEPQLRALKYAAFARQWLRDVPAVGLFQSSMNYISSRHTTNLEPSQKVILPQDRYANVIYWTAERASVYKTP